MTIRLEDGTTCSYKEWKEIQANVPFWRRKLNSWIIEPYIKPITDAPDWKTSIIKTCTLAAKGLLIVGQLKALYAYPYRVTDLTVKAISRLPMRLAMTPPVELPTWVEPLLEPHYEFHPSENIGRPPHLPLEVIVGPLGKAIIDGVIDTNG